MAPTRIREGIETTTKQVWWSLLTLGVISVLFGVVALGWPGPTTLVAGILFGAFLLVRGVVQTISGLTGEADNRTLSITSGALSLILGGFCFRDDIANSVGILGVFIGISWIFGGVWQITAGIAGKHLPHRTLIVITGIVTLIGGFILVASPWNSMVILMLVTGIFSIAIGITEIISAFRIRNKARQIAQTVDSATTQVTSVVGEATDRFSNAANRLKGPGTATPGRTNND